MLVVARSNVLIHYIPGFRVSHRLGEFEFTIILLVIQQQVLIINQGAKSKVTRISCQHAHFKI